MIFNVDVPFRTHTFIEMEELIVPKSGKITIYNIIKKFFNKSAKGL